jgi:hypothetical protein
VTEFLKTERRMSLKAAGLLAALLAAPALPAVADNYSASTTPSPLASACTGTLGGDRVAAPTSASVSCQGNGFNNTGSAAATPGQVHAMAQGAAGNGTNATATFNGSVVFGSSVVGSFTTVQFVIPLDGTFSRTYGGPAAGEDPGSGIALTGLDAGFGLDGGNIEGFDRRVATDATGTHDLSSAFGFFDVIGDFHSDNLNIFLITAPMLLQTNVVHQFTFTLQVGVGTTGANQSATADFSQTFGFKPGFAPFILQNGITANAGDYIVNNVVVDPNAPAGGVPEPATWAMLLLGFAGVGQVARRTRRGRAPSAA